MEISAKNREEFLSYFDDSQRKFISFIFDYPERERPINSFLFNFSKDLFAKEFGLEEEEKVKEEYKRIVKSLKKFKFFTVEGAKGNFLIYEKWNDDFTCSIVINPLLIPYIFSFFEFNAGERI
ncbi:hypothetical protein MHSWG343_03710 [Candidatus Mycoplasma haematohominis]|uniref:Uncharacterized protein n=2 Tax=Candidatus Mycoplasma haematohominis TaxID=1494318 RepID=A0A478FTF4_9MOLU|nr:hypothetical protein MHSWG343_03710 [Candidatus Mycoplasma haemohominis]